VLFFEGQEERMRNADTELLFRQDSDFLYVDVLNTAIFVYIWKGIFQLNCNFVFVGTLVV